MKHIATYFNFSKKEMNGILILLIILSVILAFPYCYRYFDKPEVFDLKPFRKEINLFRASASGSATGKNKASQKNRNEIEEKQYEPNYFEFDPNGLSERDWQRLGFSARQTKVIKNYEAKGGKFYKNEDLKKIYSITETQYRNLEPYIRIRAGKPKSLAERRLPERGKEYGSIKPTVAVELNSADSITMESIRGIGPVFASRIIRYRNRLGGFYNKDQLKEVYGIDSLKYLQLSGYIVVDGSLIEKININTATFEQLRRHPYLTFKQINAIVQYRRQHGLYERLDDLNKVLILNEEIIRKIGPYLSFYF
ncbi:MAG: helix-hairpin-helix domain-containing protein, partial [Daejeonella sp.]